LSLDRDDTGHDEVGQMLREGEIVLVEPELKNLRVGDLLFKQN